MNSTLMPSGTPTLDRPSYLDTDADVRLRPIEIADVDDAARIVFEAFAGIADRHGFPRDFPTLDSARQLVAAFTEHPSIWGVVAERDGRVVGTELPRRAGHDPRCRTDHGRPRCSGGGRRAPADGGRARTGRKRRSASGCSRTRSTPASLALYASLGFEVVEPVALVAGVPSRTTMSGRSRPKSVRSSKPISRPANSCASQSTVSTGPPSCVTRSMRPASHRWRRTRRSHRRLRHHARSTSASPTRSPRPRTTCST